MIFEKSQNVEKIRNSKKLVREIRMKKLCTKFKTCTAIGSWLKVCTNGQGQALEEEKKKETSKGQYAHFQRFISYDSDGIFQTS